CLMAHYELGIALRLQNKLDESIAACRQAIQLAPRDALSHVILAEAYHDAGQLQEAIDTCKIALKLDPSMASAWAWLGNALRVQKKLPQALAAYQQAISALGKGSTDGTEYAEAHAGMGVVLSEMESHEAAANAFRVALQFSPRDATTWHNLGNALNSLKQL